MMVQKERYTYVCFILFPILFKYFEHYKCMVCEQVWVCIS